MFVFLNLKNEFQKNMLSYYNLCEKKDNVNKATSAFEQYD